MTTDKTILKKFTKSYFASIKEDIIKIRKKPIEPPSILTFLPLTNQIFIPLNKNKNS